MDLLKMITPVDLTKQLANMIEDNCNIRFKWETKAIHIEGNIEHYEFLKLNDFKKNDKYIQYFMIEFKPVLEQLSLYEDYYNLRLEMIFDESYSVVNEEETRTIKRRINTIASELFMNEIERVKIIEAIDESMFDERNIDKKKVLYLAANTLPTDKLYKLIHSKLTYPLLMFRNSDETNAALAQNFHIIYTLIYKYQVDQRKNNIPLILSNNLNNFYIDVKAVMDAFRGKQIIFR